MKKEIVINASKDRARIAIVEDGQLAELYVEHPDNVRTLGNIYLGKVAKVMGQIHAAFVDIGQKQDAFLHFSDLTENAPQLFVMAGEEVPGLEAPILAKAPQKRVADDESEPDVEETLEVEDAADESKTARTGRSRSRRRRRGGRGRRGGQGRSGDSRRTEEEEEEEERRLPHVIDLTAKSGSARPKPAAKPKPASGDKDDAPKTSDDSDAAPEAEKPKPKRRSRAKKKTEEASGADAPETAEAETPEAEEKPKPKRRSRAKKKVEDTDDDAVTADDALEAEEKPKPKRTRSRKKKVEATDDAAEATDDAPEAEETPKPKRTRSRKKKETPGEASGDDASDATPEAEEKPKPKRRSRAKKKTEDTDDADEAGDVTEAAPKPKGRTRTPKQEKSDHEKREDADGDAPEADKPKRTRSRKKKADTPDADAASGDDAPKEDKPKRTRSRSKKKTEDAPAPEAAEPEAEEKAEVKKTVVSHAARHTIDLSTPSRPRRPAPAPKADESDSDDDARGSRSRRSKSDDEASGEDSGRSRRSRTKKDEDSDASGEDSGRSRHGRGKKDEDTDASGEDDNSRSRRGRRSDSDEDSSDDSRSRRGRRSTSDDDSSDNDDSRRRSSKKDDDADGDDARGSRSRRGGRGRSKSDSDDDNASGDSDSSQKDSGRSRGGRGRSSERRDDDGGRAEETRDRGRNSGRGGRSGNGRSSSGGQKGASTWNGKAEDLLKRGSRVLVKITKEPISAKGSRVSTDISLAGRFLVLVPAADYVAVSKKIESSKERRRLRALASSLKPANCGVIVRTVAGGQDAKALDQDLRLLINKWNKIEAKLDGGNAQPPILLHEDVDMVSSIVRDLFSDDFDRILVDDPHLHRKLQNYVKAVAPEMADKVQMHRSNQPVFRSVGIEKQVEEAFSDRVNMKSGAYLIIETTEAMHVVDVNSGRAGRGKRRAEENLLAVNLESAKEIGRQLRLRDLGGIICVDFIDLRHDRDRRKVTDAIKKEFAKDRAVTKVIGMSDFGVMQITRQRLRPSITAQDDNEGMDAMEAAGASEIVQPERDHPEPAPEAQETRRDSGRRGRDSDRQASGGGRSRRGDSRRGDSRRTSSTPTEDVSPVQLSERVRDWLTNYRDNVDAKFARKPIVVSVHPLMGSFLRRGFPSPLTRLRFRLRSVPFRVVDDPKVDPLSFEVVDEKSGRPLRSKYPLSDD